MSPMADDMYSVLLPEDARWGHATGAGAHGIQLHYVRQGHGVPVLLLHGWPGFWYDWRRIIPSLATEADVIAPDLRGFGNSDKPDLPPTEAYTPDVLSADLLALLDDLNLDRVVVAGYDIGATVAQTLARVAPGRVRALALFNPMYPGIGMRRVEPAFQVETWYQHFHALPWAHRLIGHDRATVRLYLAHFYQHWMGHQAALHPQEFEAIVDMYAHPDAVRASLAYYQARAGTRLRDVTADPATLRLSQPTVVLWGEADPVARASFADRLPEYFPNVSVRLLPGVGHFVPIEAPQEALAAIRAALAATTA